MSTTKPFKITVLYSNSVRVVLFILVKLLIYLYKQINLITPRILGHLHGYPFQELGNPCHYNVLGGVRATVGGSDGDG